MVWPLGGQARTWGLRANRVCGDGASEGVQDPPDNSDLEDRPPCGLGVQASSGNRAG